MLSRITLTAAVLLLFCNLSGCNDDVSAPAEPTPQQGSPPASAPKSEIDSASDPISERTAEEVQEARRIRDELHVALQQGDIQQAEKLVAAGADPNERYDEEQGENKGTTILHHVCNAITPGGYQDRIAAAHFLLEHGADPNATSDHGWSPAAEAVWWNYFDLLKLLAEYDADLKMKTPGPWPNDIEDFTLLHVAALKGRPEVVEWLIERGLDVNAQNGIGATPLSLAYKKPATLRVLLAYGADKNIKSDDGETALFVLQRDQHTYKEGTPAREDVDAAIELLKED